MYEIVGRCRLCKLNCEFLKPEMIRGVESARGSDFVYNRCGRGKICMKSLGRCRLCKLNLGFCGRLRVVILEANYLNPSFCRVYYWWLGGFGMLIGAREG